MIVDSLSIGKLLKILLTACGPSDIRAHTRAPAFFSCWKVFQKKPKKLLTRLECVSYVCPMLTTEHSKKQNTKQFADLENRLKNMKNLSNHVLKDYAKAERVNRIFIKWEQRAREFRCLDFKTLKAYGRANSRWSALPCWELEKYKSAVESMSDAELKAITN